MNQPGYQHPRRRDTIVPTPIRDEALRLLRDVGPERTAKALGLSRCGVLAIIAGRTTANVAAIADFALRGAL